MWSPFLSGKKYNSI